jgi:hypothetical protein
VTRSGSTVGDDVGDLGDPGDDLDGERGEQVLGERAGGDPADGLAGGGRPPPATRAQAVAGVVGVVGVRGAVELGELVVVVAAGVVVGEEHARSGCRG